MGNEQQLPTEAPAKKNILFEVPTLSKSLAAILFIALPFIGFVLGVDYEKQTTLVAVQTVPAAPNENVPVVSRGKEAQQSGREAVSDTNAGTNTATAYILAIDDDLIVFDYVDVLTGEAAVQAQIRDGICAEEGRCSLLYDRNVSEQWRAYNMLPTAEVLSDRGETISLDQLHKYISSTTPEGHRFGPLFTIFLNGNSDVYRMEGIFRP